MSSESGNKNYSPQEIEKIVTENYNLSEQVKRLIRTEYDLYNTQEKLDIQLSLYRDLYETGKRISSMKEFGAVFAEMGDFIINSLNFGGYLLLEKKADSFETVESGGCCLRSDEGREASNRLPIADNALPPATGVIGFFATESSVTEAQRERLQNLCDLDTFVSHFLFLGNEKEPRYLLIVGNPRDNDFFTEIELDSGHMVSLGNLISLIETVLNNQLYYQQLKEERALLEIKVNQRTDELNKAMDDLKVLNDKLEVYSFQDELTGLYNRRGFFVFGEKFLEMAKRQGKQILVLYCDLDKFKPINDSFGHKEGDLALQTTARILKSVCRSYDIISRFGGDEFVILFDNFTEADFDHFLGRFEHLFDEYNEHSGKGYRLLISYGYTIFSPEKDGAISFDTLIERADKKLYREKHRKWKAERA